MRDEGDSVAIDRHRQAVSPAGDLTEEFATISARLGRRATGLEQEARNAGLSRSLGSRDMPATPDYVGSTVVMLEAAA